MGRKSDGDTKRRFVMEALKLFSEKGYEAVSVAQIAEAVGCSAPALYKHYKSKQELFDAILENSETSFQEKMKSLQCAFDSSDEGYENILGMSVNEQIENMQNIFLKAVHDEAAQAFRKLCVVEQFHMPRLAEAYTYRYVTFHYDQLEKVFDDLIKRGRVKAANPRVLAQMYVSVLIISIEICDREPHREEECLKVIAENITEFNRSYFIC